MNGSRLLGLVLASSVVGCAAQHDYVRPWFRITTPPRHVLAPHAIEWGGAPRAEILVEGSWRELGHEGFITHEIGDAVAVDELAFVDPRRQDPGNDERAQGASGVFIYRADRAEPIRIPPERCVTPRYSREPPEIACFGCGERAPYRRLDAREGGACTTLDVDRFDTFGRQVAHAAFASPIVRPEVEGRTPNGPWILADGWRRDDFLFVSAPKMRFAVDAGGVHPLPFGADPLHAELGAAIRAREISQEVGIRDAAVAALEAQFAEDERAHSERVMKLEVVNQLRTNQALEPEAPAEPGTCYTLVARASDGITRLEVSIHAGPIFVPEKIETVREGVLAFATGASVAKVSRCARAGDPARYHYRIGSRGGAGYVVARVYAHPPEP